MNSADLTEKADAAFRAIVQVVIQRAKQAGTPIVVWENDRIKEIPWQEFEQTERQDSVKNEGRT
jgi:hypothetical protein